MSLTIFILLFGVVGGGVFLYGIVPAGAVTRVTQKIDDWAEGKTRRERGRHAKKKSANKKSEEPEARCVKYRAVSLRCGEHPCEAARKIEGKRILVSDFPKMPLTLCDAGDCHCTFKHHDDRRSGADRRDVLRSLANDKDSKYQNFRSRSGRDRRHGIWKDELNNIEIHFD